MKAVFFDRDGTIIKDYLDHVWSEVDSPEFMDGAIETLAAVQQAGFQIIIITNQYLINEGFITLQQYKDITTIMLDTLKSEGVEVMDIFYCPHRRDEGCTCIKPNKGMVDQALAKYPELELKDSWVVGDAETDMVLAINVGMKGVWITDQKSNEMLGVKRVSNIQDILPYVKGEDYKGGASM